jgi:hypothetical protein
MIPISNRIFKSIEGQDKDLGTYTTEVTQIGILSVPDVTHLFFLSRSLFH